MRPLLRMGARLWAELWRYVRRPRVVLESIAAKKDDAERARSMSRARFWAELREGQREAEANAAASRP